MGTSGSFQIVRTTAYNIAIQVKSLNQHGANRYGSMLIQRFDLKRNIVATCSKCDGAILLSPYFGTETCHWSDSLSNPLFFKGDFDCVGGWLGEQRKVHNEWRRGISVWSPTSLWSAIKGRLSGAGVGWMQTRKFALKTSFMLLLATNLGVNNETTLIEPALIKISLRRSQRLTDTNMKECCLLLFNRSH